LPFKAANPSELSRELHDYAYISRHFKGIPLG